MADESHIRIVGPEDAIVAAISRPGLVEAGTSAVSFSSRQRLQSNADWVAHVLSVAFWAGLAHEEGRPVQSGIVIASPSDTTDAVRLQPPLDFTHKNVVRLATVAGTKSRIAIHEQDGTIKIWGLARITTSACVTVWFDRPGRLRVSLDLRADLEHSYVLGFMDHGRVHVSPEASITPRWNLWRNLAQLLIPNVLPPELIRDIAYLANETGRHGHGGTILVVPDESDAWEKDLEIRFRVDPSSRALLRGSHSPPGAVFGTILGRQVADLSRIDGAVVLTSQLGVVGFGATITSADDEEVRKVPIEVRSVFMEAFIGSSWSALGGTRHQAAARFVARNPRTAAFVSSSDGALSLLVGKSDQRGLHIARLSELEAFIPPG